MPRYLKKLKIKNMDFLQDITDNQLRSVEYAGLIYAIERFQSKKSAVNKALMVGVVVYAYEFFLENQFAHTNQKIDADRPKSMTN